MTSGGDVEVLIVGTGFGGLCTAIRLQEAGERSFLLLERAQDIGGTWRDNAYPGCACDVKSHLYSFSFLQNPDWSYAFARQPEILAYLRACADRYGLRAAMRFGEDVVNARYDEPAARWEVRTAAGHTYRARALVWAGGPLSNPAYPEIAGLGSFRGPTFHSAGWDSSYDLRGKRVAVIGTGASAIQFVPQIAPVVAHLDLYQRTAPWILPRPDRPISALERATFRRAPLVQRLVRWSIYWRLEAVALGFTVQPALLRVGERLGRRHLARQVVDPALRLRLTPGFRLGCKRILMSDDYYPALTRPNVEVVTEPIREITPDGVVTADGTARDADVLVLGTGFKTQELAPPGLITGRGGRDLAACWAGGVEAYKGTTVSGFPNLFLLLGPNTGLGHSSMIYVIESQVAYVADALRLMRERGWASVDVRPDAQAAFNAQLQTRMGRTVWQTGCRSWYLDERGRNTALWPSFTFAYRRATRRFDPDRYQVQPEPAQ